MKDDTTQVLPYLFTLFVGGIDLASETTVARLLDDGNIEVYPAVIGGKPLLTYRIAAENSYDAVLDAVGRLCCAFPNVQILRVEPDLVNITDIAARTGRPRETIRAWALGTRGKKDFPLPVSVVGDGIRIWDWTSINSWLRRNELNGYDEDNLLTREEIDELNVMLVRKLCGNTGKAFQQSRPMSESSTVKLRKPSIIKAAGVTYPKSVLSGSGA
ncbi:hypothetical protein FB565_005082 [Actinoplanes lutulentus]|uniref:AlpA family transcriptional regulator n=1 Tax=Actinoplanes lutulentus TaxID=1287878 RepID=A0A327ZIN8_9ACTN|nr:hypothetical protein [Actinoplanes lutulentus]MBB2945349.1 hypothetical protein [Actinoplanes lutulentus]RAK40518.1 hypothetical protein B0I29_103556 [Actinoplanes lutulentus]